MRRLGKLRRKYVKKKIYKERVREREKHKIGGEIMVQRNQDKVK